MGEFARLNSYRRERKALWKLWKAQIISEEQYWQRRRILDRKFSDVAW